ncbi:MAG: Bug family tripartite tricarboxylate transporter substrate binding protein [Xanthobacteraceae bacterium]
MLYRKALAAIAGVAALAATCTPASSADEADFFRGKTVTVMIPSSLGATLGLYGRMVVDLLGKHIPGNPNVIIESRPGAGGAVGAAHAYTVAPKDGTYIAEVLAPSVTLPLLRNVKFDGSKFQWIGSLVPRPAVISVWKESTPAKTLAEAKQKEVIVGSSGKGSETFLVPTLMNRTLGTKFKIVMGYKGGAEINQAMEQGEVHGRMQYWSGWTAGKPNWLRDKKLIHFVQYGPPIKELPDVPSLKSLVKDEKTKQMITFLEAANRIGMGFWVPPGTPKARVATLRKAFESMMASAEFKAMAKKLRTPVELVKGEELQRITAEAYATPKPVIAELKETLGFN